MDSFKSVALVLAAVCALVACADAQNINLVRATLPPNCDCSAFQNMMNSNMNAMRSNMNQQMNGMNQQMMQGSGGRIPRGNMGDMGGMKQMMMNSMCATDGRNYTNPCDFMNAQGSNQALGIRMCAGTSMTDMVPPMMSGMMATRPMTLCLTNSQAVNDTMTNVQQYLQSNPTVGVRCNGSCPCALSCPSGMGMSMMGMGMSMMGMGMGMGMMGM